MDIDLLSRMVAELIVEHDQVGLPGVGTFVAEMVPATFSDKGYTINPPYRRLSFYPSRTEDTLLIDLYARSNQLSREAAKTYIIQYLAELKSILEERKTIVLPGLGRLRATRENTLFFVQDEGLDIFPAGVGLEPVSLKSLPAGEDEPVVIDVPAPTTAPEETPTLRPSHVPPAWIREENWREPRGDTGLPWWAMALIVVFVLCALALGAFILLAHIAPDFIDSLLYTPDELRIINY